MLKATQLLTETSQTNYAPLLQVINRHGTLADSQAVYKLFLHKRDPALLTPVMLHGNEELATDLFKRSVFSNTLSDGFPVEVYYALSYLGHPETEHLLFRLYQQIFDTRLDWDLHRVVCLSLLNYNCQGYKAEIEKEIEKCFAVHLFPEFIPVLACKTGNTALAERLYEHGSTKASSDASAGLILGIALYGQAFKEKFKAIIWNPEWEASSSSTGNRSYTLMGMRYLGLTFSELFQDLKEALSNNKTNLRSNLYTFVDLLQANLGIPQQYPVRLINQPQESFQKINQGIFEPNGSGAVDTIVDIVESYADDESLKLSYLLNELYFIKESYSLKAAHELELACYGPTYSTK